MVITGGIVHKLSMAKRRVAPEEPNPRSGGPIGFFEAYAISRLDFKLPEDYKHSFPSSAPAHRYSRISSTEKSGVPSVGSIPIGYISIKVSHYPCCVINES